MKSGECGEQVVGWLVVTVSIAVIVLTLPLWRCVCGGCGRGAAAAGGD